MPKKVKILVVEDNETHAKLAVRNLKKNFRVGLAYNGMKALEMLSSPDEDYEAMLLDLKLPDFDARNLIDKIHRMKGTHFPIVMTSARGSDEIAIESFRLGAFDYIPKSGDYAREVVSLRKGVKEFRRMEKIYQKVEATKWDKEIAGLLEKTEFMDEVRKDLALAQRDKTIRSIFFIDIDGLKELNDQVNHLFGTDVILKLGSMLKSVMHRIGDLITRYGGDEFLIFSHDIDVDVVINRMHEGLKQLNNDLKAGKYAVDVTKHSIEVTFSVGWALTKPKDNESYNLESLLKRADDMLYQDKARNKVKAALEKTPQ